MPDATGDDVREELLGTEIGIQATGGGCDCPGAIHCDRMQNGGESAGTQHLASGQRKKTTERGLKGNPKEAGGKRTEISVIEPERRMPLTWV